MTVGFAVVVPIYELRLVADEADPAISVERWNAVQWMILELQPARSVRLEGDPPRMIRVEAYGEIMEMAPGLLADIERLTKTSLRVEFPWQ
jgi:hypothetical protein